MNPRPSCIPLMVRDSARARIEKPASQVDGAAAAGAAARGA
eukprot:COSAG01_NODE_8878_length_2628_cov_6.631079_1_plen_40_part_10